MEEVVAHPDVDHGRLRRNGFHGRMRIDAGFHRKESGIAGADESGAAVVAGDVFEQPVDGVVGVGAFVYGLGIAMVGFGAAHHELAFALEAAANVLQT